MLFQFIALEYLLRRHIVDRNDSAQFARSFLRPATELKLIEKCLIYMNK